MRVLPFLVVALLPPLAIAGQEPLQAFRGELGDAVGFGAHALADCRENLPLAVHFVDARADDGDPGSLRDVLTNAVADSTYDIVMFDYGGILELDDGALSPEVECVYVAGQTAPGDGIVLWAPNNSYLSFIVPRDLVFRYVRSRIHGGMRGLEFRGGLNLIVDHTTVSWFDGFGGGHVMFQVRAFESACGTTSPCIENVTVSNNMIYEPNETRPLVWRFGTATDDEGTLRSTSLSVTRNFTSLGWRQPKVSGADSVRVANNIVYNWTNRAGSVNTNIGVDFVENLYREGPDINGQTNRRTRMVQVRSADIGSKRLHLHGNRTIHNGYVRLVDQDSIWGIEGDAWQIVCNATENGCVENDPAPTSMRSLTPYPPAPVPEYGDMTDALHDEILDGVGVSRLLNCDGTVRPARDATDADRISRYNAGESPPDSLMDGTQHGVNLSNIDVPGMGYSAGTPCARTSDGLWHDWLSTNGFDPQDPPSADSVTADGYLLVEHQINALPLASEGAAPTWTGRWVYTADVIPFAGFRMPDVAFPARRAWYSNDNQEALVVSCSDQGTALTAAQVVSWISENMLEAPDIENETATIC